MQANKEGYGTAPCLFLDRDGVVNEERGYIYNRHDFIFLEGVFDSCRKASMLGYRIVIVTNQGGIGRGLYTQAQFHALTRWMLKEFVRQGVMIDRVYHSPYHPEASIPKWRRDAPCRKPHPGMLLRAADELGLDLGRSIMVGDRLSDIEAARRAGLPHRVFLTGHGSAQDEPAPDDAVILSDLTQFSDWLQL